MPIVLSGSLELTGSVVATGNFTTTGNITAQTLVVQTITSSINYITGSSDFGSLQSNRHTFTGSFYQTGSVAYFSNCIISQKSIIANASAGSAIITAEGTATNGEGTITVAGKNSSGTSRSAIFKYDNADIIRIATADAISMRFETSDVTRMTIANTGDTIFSCGVTVSGLLKSCQDLQLLGVNPKIDYPNGSSLRLYQTGVGTTVDIASTGVVAFSCGITAIGNTGVGTTTPISTNIKGALTIVKCHNNDTPVSPAACNYADNQSGLYIFGRNSGVTIVANNNEEGEIIFGSPCTRAYARIVTATQSTTIGGDMYFKVGSDTERMRITNIGNVGVGNACPTYKLQITTDCTSQQYAPNLILETTATGDYHPGLYFKGCRAGCQHEASIVLDGGAANGADLYLRVKNINGSWIRPIVINAAGCISLARGQNDQATAIFQPDNVGATITVCRTGVLCTYLPFTILDAGSCQNMTGNGGGYSYGSTCMVAGVVSATADTLFGIMRASNDNVAPGFKGFKGRGDTYTPASVCTEDQTLTIEGWAFHGSGPNQAKFGAGMRFVKDDAYGTANTYAPQRTEFYNANTGTTTLTTFIIYPNGNYDPTGTDVSDRRFKCNINYITNEQSSILMKLKPVTFNKIRGMCVENPVTFTGFIAQDVLESCIPNLVTGTEIEGYGLDYNGILTMIVKGFQEQQCTICSQASIINTLKTCIGIS